MHAFFLSGVLILQLYGAPIPYTIQQEIGAFPPAMLDEVGVIAIVPRIDQGAVVHPEGFSTARAATDIADAVVYVEGDRFQLGDLAHEICHVQDFYEDRFTQETQAPGTCFSDYGCTHHTEDWAEACRSYLFGARAEQYEKHSPQHRKLLEVDRLFQEAEARTGAYDVTEQASRLLKRRGIGF